MKVYHPYARTAKAIFSNNQLPAIYKGAYLHMKESKFCEYFTEEVARRYDRRSLILDTKRKYKFLLSTNPGACGTFLKDQKPHTKKVPRKIMFSERQLRNTIGKLELEIALLESSTDQLYWDKAGNIFKCSAGEQLAYNRKQAELLKRLAEQHRQLHEEVCTYMEGIKQYQVSSADVSPAGSPSRPGKKSNKMKKKTTNCSLYVYMV